jgi:hypothetical protein
MALWKVALLVNLSLVLGVSWGYVIWGSRVARLEREMGPTRLAEIGPIALPGGEREWRVRGTVRALLAEINVVVLSHESIPGYMPGMTMGFRMASPQVPQGIAVGDTVTFTLRGVPPDLVVTAIEKAR